MNELNETLAAFSDRPDGTVVGATLGTLRMAAGAVELIREIAEQNGDAGAAAFVFLTKHGAPT